MALTDLRSPFVLTEIITQMKTYTTIDTPDFEKPYDEWQIISQRRKEHLGFDEQMILNKRISDFYWDDTRLVIKFYSMIRPVFLNLESKDDVLDVFVESLNPITTTHSETIINIDNGIEFLWEPAAIAKHYINDSIRQILIDERSAMIYFESNEDPLVCMAMKVEESKFSVLFWQPCP